MRRAVGEPGEEVEVKIYLSNAPAETPLAELVRVSGLRWPIECCFEESKSELGLDHYEVRSWPGWHHHMTLVLLAHHFLVRLQQRLNQRGGAFGAASPAARAGPSGRDDKRSISGSGRSGAERGASASAVTGCIAASFGDITATLELVRYQRQRNAAAYYAHRKRRLRQLSLPHPP